MDETIVKNDMENVNPNKEGLKHAIKRDAKGRFPKGVTGNPKGYTGPKQLTAQQFIDSLYKVHGVAAVDKVLKLAIRLAGEGNTTLLCKIMDKILPSKIENKGELLITHREEFLKMRARAMQILRDVGSDLN